MTRRPLTAAHGLLAAGITAVVAFAMLQLVPARVPTPPVPHRAVALSERTTEPDPPTTVVPTTMARANRSGRPLLAPVTRRQPVVITGNVWDLLARCESGGRWDANTGNGYYGGLQMDMPFWRSYGGPAFAPRPDLATREQQITVATRARDSGRGYTPWPACSRRLRLR